MKFALWAVIAVLVVLWVLKGKKAAVQAGMSKAAAEARPQRLETMVRCQHCGVHFPASEAVRGQRDVLFCSEEHRRVHSSGRT